MKSVTGNKILRILKKSGLAPAIPEDLYMLIKKAVAGRKHLERNKKDKDSKFRLILIESRIHRYYITGTLIFIFTGCELICYAFTDYLDTTALLESLMPTGSTSPPLPPLWSLKQSPCVVCVMQ